MLKVVVHEKGGRTQRFNFESDQFSVGREEDNDLVLDRVNISKHHLRLRRAQGAVEIVDLSSTNGTYVNGRKVGTPRQVRKSDRIYVGDYILMLEGDDDAIAPVMRSEIIVAGDGQHPERRSVAVPPTRRDAGEALSPGAVPKPLAHLTGDDNDDVLTSARRVAPAGMESTFVDKVVNRILQTALANINSLDPVREAEISEEDVAATNALIESLVADMRRAGEFEEGLDVDLIIGQAKRELLGLGPLSELMKDADVREIQVVGSGSIRIVHDRNEGGTDIELTARRFSGDRALILATQRLARTWGFLHEGTQVLEGKVDEGFWMYALLPPTQVRHPVVNLRRQRTDASNLAALVQEGVLSADMAELLAAAIRGSRRILVSASGGINL
ncbi:MAG: Flp pilus assembly complex ATPase component TadA, partial [Nannocystaceae bacterium]|nr:Flp pilus assembly complex ATPase component TadA [Nannocystaceae bacterium]